MFKWYSEYDIVKVLLESRPSFDKSIGQYNLFLLMMNSSLGQSIYCMPFRHFLAWLVTGIHSHLYLASTYSVYVVQVLLLCLFEH